MSVAVRFGALGREGVDPVDSLTLSVGGAADVCAMGRFHYLREPPATLELVLVLRDGEECVACLAVSRPVLNAWWRKLAWPGVFEHEDKREAAARVNADLRTISRVIVDPRYRGVGAALRLVRTYLASPRTRYTEAVAAMGRACPFFERAGMAAHCRPRGARDDALLAVLGGKRGEDNARKLLTGPVSPRVARALRTWANDSRATRHLRDSPIREIARVAAAALLAPPMAYTSSPPQRGNQPPKGGPCPSTLIAAPLSTPMTCTAGLNGALMSRSVEARS